MAATARSMPERSAATRESSSMTTAPAPVAVSDRLPFPPYCRNAALSPHNAAASQQRNATTERNVTTATAKRGPSFERRKNDASDTNVSHALCRTISTQHFVSD
ncbi:MAG: hypothetical protein KA144_04575, partial [Xanthomonadaceae bacterium]|nr:hypothetical protein [Xanthomonadaceae bacterium]